MAIETIGPTVNTSPATSPVSSGRISSIVPETRVHSSTFKLSEFRPLTRTDTTLPSVDKVSPPGVSFKPSLKFEGVDGQVQPLWKIEAGSFSQKIREPERVVNLPQTTDRRVDDIRDLQGEKATTPVTDPSTSTVNWKIKTETLQKNSEIKAIKSVDLDTDQDDKVPIESIRDTHNKIKIELEQAKVTFESLQKVGLSTSQVGELVKERIEEKGLVEAFKAARLDENSLPENLPSQLKELFKGEKRREEKEFRIAETRFAVDRMKMERRKEALFKAVDEAFNTVAEGQEVTGTDIESLLIAENKEVRSEVLGDNPGDGGYYRLRKYLRELGGRFLKREKAKETVLAANEKFQAIKMGERQEVSEETVRMVFDRKLSPTDHNYFWNRMRVLAELRLTRQLGFDTSFVVG